jgi:adenosylhomocysteine nucleosidase
MPLGLMGAMPEEIDALRPHLAAPQIIRRAGRDYLAAELWGTPVVLVFSRWGKVAAASTATELIVSHGATRVVFLGIAGALDPDLRPGDVVVARDLYQHDLDASPFFRPTEIPLLGVSAITADASLSGELLDASAAFLEHDLAHEADPALVDRLSLRDRRALSADIASGDQVIFSAAARLQVLARVPTAVCVEMEGAAVAQVCHEHAVPFGCVRIISDSADESGAQDSAPFFQGLAGLYTRGILRRWLVR